MSATIQEIIALATKAHAGQFRFDGKTPYIEHPKAVAKYAEALKYLLDPL